MPIATAADVEIIIQTLESKLAGGVVEIEFQGRKTTYDTGASKIEALRYFRQRLLDLTGAESVTPISRITRLYSDKGL